MRDHLDVDAGLVHLLEAQRAEIEQPLLLRAGPPGFDPGVGLGQFGVPVVLLDGDDRAIRLLEHRTSQHPVIGALVSAAPTPVTLEETAKSRHNGGIREKKDT